MDAVYSFNISQLKQESSLEFSDLYRDYKHKIFTFLVVKSHGNTQMAEEVLSDTIYSALLSAPKLYNNKKTFGWLIQIANRRFYDHLRKEYLDKELIEKIIIKNKINSHFHAPEKDDKIFMLKTAMKFLKPKYRKIITLKYLENHSQKEIAKILKISRLSAESLIHRAREALKKQVKKLFHEQNY